MLKGVTKLKYIITFKIVSNNNKIMRMTQLQLQETLQQNSITYIYDPNNKYYTTNKYWVEVNTKHMQIIFSKYHDFLRDLDYNMIIQINEEIIYISRDYKSIIEYFKKNSNEYTNDIYKKISIKYKFN